MKLRTLSAAVLAATLVMPGLAFAQDEEEKSWSLELGVDYADTYLFRGIDLLAGEGVIVPRAILSVGNFAFATYGYAGDITPDGDYREIDFSADYTFSFGKMSLTTGALTYQYNRDTEEQLAFFDTYEVYAIASWDVPLAPFVSYYHDIEAVEGGYAQIGISHDFGLGESVTLGLSGAVGIDFGYNLNAGLAESLGIDESSGDLSDLLFGADLSWQATDAFALHALVQRTVALDVLDDIGQDDLTVVTAGLSYSF